MFVNINFIVLSNSYNLKSNIPINESKGTRINSRRFTTSNNNYIFDYDNSKKIE